MNNKTRSFDVKRYQSMPDDFDIIKVQQLNTAGDIIEQGSIIYVTSKAADSDIPINTGDYGKINNTIILKTGDDIFLVGYQKNYAGIQTITNCDFADDNTSVMINNIGKNMSLLNTLQAGMTILAAFTKVSIPKESTNSILIAYR